MKTVLLTGGGGAATEAISRLWRDRYVVHFADADRNSIPSCVPVERRHEIPLAAHPDFGKSLAQLCSDIGADVIIPGVDEELSRIRPALSQAHQMAILMPDDGYVSQALDKWSCMRELGVRQIEIPQTVRLDDIASLGFPCLVKPRWGRGSRGVRQLSSLDQMRAYLLLDDIEPDQVLAQELLTGEEFTVMMAADAYGELRCLVPVQVGAKKGITLHGEIVSDPAVVATCRAIHAAWPTSGLYNIQLMKCFDGRVLPFEINPRISTTTCLALAAGVDPIAIFMAPMGMAEEIIFKDGLKLHRYWKNVFES